MALNVLFRLSFLSIIILTPLHQIWAQLTISNIQQYQVIQRTPNSDVATFEVSGTCGSGTLKIQLLLQNQSTSATIEPFSYKELSAVTVTGTGWKGTITELPVGGEYTMKFKALNSSGTATDSSSVIQNVLVGDIWLCSGQSNMQG